MGILRNGFYSRGYKTTEEIYDMTGMRYGDTVFDTTRKERRIYDGNVWVTGSMITKQFTGSSSTAGSITYVDSAKCGQMVSFATANSDNLVVTSTGSSSGGNIENGIGILQYPINRSYRFQSGTGWSAVQYSGQAYVWADNTGNYVGQYVTLAPVAVGGTVGNYYIWAGRGGKNVSTAIGEIGVWSVAPTNVVVSSTTTPPGYTGTIPLGKAFIRFGETN